MRIMIYLSIVAIACTLLPSNASAQTYVGYCAISGARNICMKDDSNFVFICTESSGFISVDVSDPTHPVIADNLSISSGTISHIFIRGNSAFLSGYSTHLNIIDISNPDDLTLITNWDTDREFVHCSYVVNNIAYLSTCFRLLVADVTDETHPEILHEIGNCGDGYGMCADENYLYMGDMNRGLVIFDISDISNPGIISTTPIFNYITYFSSTYNRYVFLPSSYQGVAVIDASDPLSPGIADTISSIDQIYSTFVFNNYLFVVSVNNHPNQPSGLFIYDIMEPANPQLAGYYTGDFTGVWATEQYIYLVNNYRLVILSFDATPIYREREPVPNNASLLSSYPNPFNAQTTISYSLAEPGPVTLTIYNLLGQKVATLVDGIQPAGEHQAVWDASNMTSAIYFSRITTNLNLSTLSMMLIK